MICDLRKGKKRGEREYFLKKSEKEEKSDFSSVYIEKGK